MTNNDVSNTNVTQPHPPVKPCDHRNCPDHTCVLNGLWWDDEEFRATAAGEIWRVYVKRKREFDQWEHETAITLGQILKVMQ